ncbi:hypothetical protein ABZS68_38620 [Streptomyces sp. NPDC005571]|uniref:hypothetical protein n=1 Tax=Streptomyces sp. NPDC005571 TaxID=3156888 RepID=UPI00339FD99D
MTWRPLTTAEPPSRPASPALADASGTVPRHDLLSSLAGRGPIPFWKIPHVLALVAEQKRSGHQRDPQSRTWLERFQESRGAASAEDKIASAERRVNNVIESAEHLKARRDVILAEAEHMDQDHISGPHGELLTIEDAAERQAQLSATVDTDVDNGSLRHRRVPPGLRRWATVVALIDFPVLIYFLASIFNLDMTNLLGSPIQVAVTAVLAALGTAGLALGLRKFGYSLRGHKDDHGHLRLPRGARVLPILYLILFCALLVGCASMMGYRIVSDATASGVPPSAAWTLAAFFSIVTCAVNVVVFSVEFNDGSTATEQIDYLTSKIIKIRARQQAARRQADQLHARITKLQQRGERLIQRVLTNAGDGLAAAHQVILIARAYHQGCGPVADLAHPGNDTRQPPGYLNEAKIIDTQALELAAEHLASTTNNP